SRDPANFTYARLYCAPDGTTHFQDVTVELRKTDFAPPAPPIHIGSDFAASRAFFGGFDAGWALRTSKSVSIILLPQLNSPSSCKVAFPSPRPTVRRGDCVPAACFAAVLEIGGHLAVQGAHHRRGRPAWIPYVRAVSAERLGAALAVEE